MTCAGPLEGRQRKYCSRVCKNSDTNNRLQSYAAQQRRGRDRKIRLIRLKGSACESCGYAKNYAAMEFHHREPRKKSFQLDLRSLSNRRWEVILKELAKCSLLCANCHAELHNPDARM